MGNITTLAASYATHPYFHFGSTPMSIDAARIEAFNLPYGQMRLLSRELTGTQLEAATAAAVQALRAVADELRPQATDEFEGRFLSELFERCEALVREQGAGEQQRRTVGLGSAPGNALDFAGKLASERYFFERLPEEVTNEINAVAKDTVASLKQAAAEGRTRREDLSVNSGPVVHSIVKILNRAFAASGVLAAVSSYAGTKMAVSGLALELSVPQAGWWANAFPDLERAPSTLYAHLDESVHHPKAIVYLTDVGPQNGPTSCYPHAYEALNLTPLQDLVGRVVAGVGSSPQSPLYELYQRKYHQAMTSERFRAHYMRLPEQVRFNSHFGWDVMPGSAIEQSMEGTQKVMMGPAGTFIAFDGGHLVHRGGLIQTGERVVLQVIFSATSLQKKVIGKIKSMLP